MTQPLLTKADDESPDGDFAEGEVFSVAAVDAEVTPLVQVAVPRQDERLKEIGVLHGMENSVPTW